VFGVMSGCDLQIFWSDMELAGGLFLLCGALPVEAKCDEEAGCWIL
jgi:hypothetical protein